MLKEFLQKNCQVYLMSFVVYQFSEITSRFYRSSRCNTISYFRVNINFAFRIYLYLITKYPVTKFLLIFGMFGVRFFAGTLYFEVFWPFFMYTLIKVSNLGEQPPTKTIRFYWSSICKKVKVVMRINISNDHCQANLVNHHSTTEVYLFNGPTPTDPGQFIVLTPHTSMKMC